MDQLQERANGSATGVAMMRRVLRRLLPVMLLCAAAGGVVWVAVPGMPPPVQRALGLRPPPAIGRASCRERV